MNAFSAFGTVGLSLGITGSLSSVGKIVIISTMIFGRFGLLIMAMDIFKTSGIKGVDFPDEEVFNRMSKKICIIGLSSFGERSLKMLVNMDVELIIIDKDKEVIQNFKDLVSDAYIVDVTHFEAVKKVLPKAIDIAIIDLGKSIEASILIASHLHKLGIPKIVARADSDQHGSILDMVGATKVVYPNQEAVQRIIPILMSDSLLNYIPINEEIIILEVTIPDQHLGKNVLELDLRNRFNINIIAVNNAGIDGYKFFKC